LFVNPMGHFFRSLNRTQQATVYMMGMVLMFAMLETTAKSLTQTYSVVEIVWFRYISHFVIMLIVFVPKFGIKMVRTNNPKEQLLRATLLMGSTGFYFTSLSFLPLATAKSISFVSPLLVTVFACWILKEVVSASRWIAVVVGFLGVLFVVNPTQHFDWHFLLPLVAATCYSLYQIMTRNFSNREDAVTTLFYTALVGTVVLSFMIPFFWVSPKLIDLPKFLFLGVAGAAGHFMLIKAMGLEQASFLSPLGYVQLIWVTIFGFIAFGHLPDMTGFIGMFVIVLAGLYVALGHKTKSREVPDTAIE